MVFEHIEKLKQEFTDKFVVVDNRVAELQRFEGLTGTVRTVNMNGRALVEFTGHNNIGWYDIDVDFLSVIDKPLPIEEEKPAPKKAAAKPEKAPSKLEQARGGKTAPTKPGMSVADVLAAARENKSAASKAPAKKPSGGMSVEAMLAAARGEKTGGAETAEPAVAASESGNAKAGIQQKMEAARQQKTATQASSGAARAKPTAADPAKMTVEQMLAAARSETSGDVAPVPEAPTESTSPEPAAEQPAAADSAASGSRRDITEVADQLAYCRKVDG